jgi:uncharacterized protein (TIGR00255 family)
VLLSMTGFGDARKENGRVNVSLEIRSVNNRYFKLVTKTPETFTSREADIEKIVRKVISRGSVTLTVRIDRIEHPQRYQLNRPILEEYWKELKNISETNGTALPEDMSSLLSLPDAMYDAERNQELSDSDWKLIQDGLNEALEKLQSFRIQEGEATVVDLKTQLSVISAELEAIKKNAPEVVEAYRDRIAERVNKLLENASVSVENNDLIREVSIFADRCDINEEVSRLSSHLEQFSVFLNDQRSQGRKLDFLTQEMFREVNTIGSKANNVKIAHHVVEMKSSIERMRENLQNVE